MTLTAAATDVLAERQRQIEGEGWDASHDDKHQDGQMALAASHYARHAVPPDEPHPSSDWCPDDWPWHPKWWKPKDPRRDLVKAGALILAEIERLDRAAAAKAA